VITPETSIEDLITSVPESVTYLMRKGIKCLACGEPVWGTLGQAAREKGFSDQDIIQFVSDLRQLAGNHAPQAPASPMDLIGTSQK
jgi:hypothetical protein